MKADRWIRIALGYLAVVGIEIGLWALLAPRSFFDRFPGFGRSWVSVDGPYNEHLVRDVGALNLALVVVLVVAAVTLSRTLVMTASGAWLVWGVPHLLYHLANTDGYESSDVAGSVGGLAVGVVVAAAVLVSTYRRK